MVCKSIEVDTFIYPSTRDKPGAYGQRAFIAIPANMLSTEKIFLCYFKKERDKYTRLNLKA